jgi:predicted ester cyclase
MGITQRSRDDVVRGLIRIGEQAIALEDDAALDAYFANGYVLHGPDGDLDYPTLKRYFAALRDALADFRVTREQIIVEGDFVAARTTMSGVFEREFTQSPVGPLPPNGKPIAFHIINIFRYDDEGRLAEEWIQIDNRGVLRQLGANVD